MTTSTGCMLGWYDANGYSGTNGLEDMETALGTSFALTRVYNQWWPDHSGTITTATNDGRLVLSSHKPPKHANSWVEIARGDQDSAITSMVAFYKALAPAEVIFIFNHEPHANATDGANHSPTYGKLSDFVGAYRRIAKAFRDANATNVKLGYCAVANFWACRGTPVGTGDHGYPGDDVVDVLCHDDYNFFTNLNPSNWDSMETVMSDTVALAKRLRKPLIWGELGCQHGAAGEDRDTWFIDGAAYLKTGDAAAYTLGFCYYHVDNHNNSGHYWRFAQGTYAPDGKTGFIEKFAQDSYFLTNPLPVSLRKAAPPAAIPPTAVQSGGGIPSNVGFGTMRVSLDAGPITITSVGAIPAPGDYEDPEESPGLDFGTLTVSFSSSPDPDDDLEGDFLFSPPVAFDVPRVLPETVGVPYLLMRHYSELPRGRTVIKLGGVYQTVDNPEQFTLDAASEVYLGGHIYNVTAEVATALVDAGYTVTPEPSPPARTLSWGFLAGGTWDDFHDDYRTWG